MGHQIYAGDFRICFSDGAWLVVGWCQRYEPPKPNRNLLVDTGAMGSTEIPDEWVQKADSEVPRTFSEAYDGGWLDGHFRTPIDEHEFIECRNFLANAARSRTGISGSF